MGSQWTKAGTRWRPPPPILLDRGGVRRKTIWRRTSAPKSPGLGEGRAGLVRRSRRTCAEARRRLPWGRIDVASGRKLAHIGGNPPGPRGRGGGALDGAHLSARANGGAF